MDALKEHIQDTANEHETNKSENMFVEENAVYIFCQEDFLNSASVERRFRCTFFFFQYGHMKGVLELSH